MCPSVCFIGKIKTKQCTGFIIFIQKYHARFFLLDSPQVTERNKTYVVSPGDSVTLTCPIDGNPPPSVQWYKGNDNIWQPLHTGKAWELVQATSSDSGLYTCSASNSVGTVTTTVILEVGE